MDQTEAGGTVRGRNAESSAAVELSDFPPCSSDGLDGERMGLAKPTTFAGVQKGRDATNGSLSQS